MVDEVGTILENAIREWDFASEQNSIPAYKNAKGLFLLALKKAGKPIPRIHSFLAMLYYDLAICYSKKQDRNSARYANEAIKSATKYADTALQNEPLEFRAQFIKTCIVGDNILFLNAKTLNSALESRGVMGNFFEVVGRVIGIGAGAAQVSVSKSNFKKELERLLAIYDEFSANYVMPASEVFFFANKLLGIAEFCSENRLFGPKEIYTIIANINVEELDFDDLDSEVKAEVLEDINYFKTLAEARLMAL
jgi:hypothetical protein